MGMGYSKLSISQQMMLCRGCGQGMVSPFKSRVIATPGFTPVPGVHGPQVFSGKVGGPGFWWTQVFFDRSDPRFGGPGFWWTRVWWTRVWWTQVLADRMWTPGFLTPDRCFPIFCDRKLLQIHKEMWAKQHEIPQKFACGEHKYIPPSI